MKKIGFATGSRADYGIMRRYLERLNRDPDIELSVIATGALLAETYGHQVDLIYADGFYVAAEIEIQLDTSSNRTVLHAMSECLAKFADYFEENRFDLLIILGDRYEMLSVATAAAIHRIPILHIHGGEATFGNYDEFIRHAITKMGTYHFTATEAYRQRVIQLGEHPDRVFCLGALGAENCLFINTGNVPETVRQLPEKGYFVVLFHPETLTNTSTLEQVNSLLEALSEFDQFRFVFLGTNADTNSYIIRETIRRFVEHSANSIYFENLHTDAYHYLLQKSICLIGNSSSGIIEAPSLGVYTINIGDRQKGRVRGNSVIDTICSADAITEAIRQVLSSYDQVMPENPYYQENSAELYFHTTKVLLNRIDDDKTEPKVFYDMQRTCLS